jgi:hypothetical protein
MKSPTANDAANGAPRGDAAAVTRELLLLATALDEEAVLAESLREALTQMRSAVAGGDPLPLDREAEALGRILHTLQEARRRRGSILAALAGDEAFPLEGLARDLEVATPPALEAARQRLRRAGEAVVREATINRAVLRRALEQGDHFLQALFSAATAPAYGPAERAAGCTAGAAVLFNRRA